MPAVEQLVIVHALYFQYIAEKEGENVSFNLHFIHFKVKSNNMY